MLILRRFFCLENMLKECIAFTTNQLENMQREKSKWHAVPTEKMICKKTPFQ